MQKQISILKSPKFWTDTAGNSILRTKLLKGPCEYDIKWCHLYNIDCKICKRQNSNVKDCKHRNLCKLYVIKNEEGVIRVERNECECQAAS